MIQRKKNLILLGIIIIILGVGIFFVIKKEPSKDYAVISNEDYKNTSYTIDGQTITLKDGISINEIAPNSASKSTTKYFGNEVKADLDGDGLQDIAFLITNDNGGSGTFYYLVAAINTKNGYVGTNAVLLGDRVAPQSTEFKNGEIIVNFADRLPTEPMTTKPSIGISKYFKVVDNKLIESTNLN